ncbi:MAG: hypothetical protein QM758_29885 [Armatimonas sp.]
MYWKESQRPDLSALTPKIRAKALANREKREAKPKPAWRNFLESLASIGIVCAILWGVSYFLAKSHVPPIGLYIAPMLGTMGMGAALTRSIILEREKRTWDSLLLSNLTPAQILMGKFLPWLRQIAWVTLSMSIFLTPTLINGTLPLWVLALAAPIMLTAYLPGGMLAMSAGLHAPSMERGMARMNKLVLLPVVANLVAAGAGMIGIQALLHIIPGVLIPAWLSVLVLAPWLMMVLNLLWTRKLWHGLLRDFHKAPSDFSG